MQPFRLASLLKRDLHTGVFLCILRIFVDLFWKTSANGCFLSFSYFSNLFFFGCLFTIIKENYELLWRRKCLLKLDYIFQWRYFKEHVKIVEICMVKINVSILNRLINVRFFVNAKYIHKHDVIWNKTLTKLLTI